MPAEPVISVRGQATLEVEPEIALVWVVVMARDADRRKAVDLLAGRSGRVADMIKGYGEAIEKLESQPVNVQPVFKDGRIREKVSGYLARAGFTVTVRDFAVLGDLVAGLADADMVTVTGPDWQLRPDSPVYRAARLAAATDATQRAREYAEAFGGRLDELIEAADTGLLTRNAEQGVQFRAMAAGGMARASAPEPADMDFEPVRQTVTAQVEARFGMQLPEPRHG